MKRPQSSALTSLGWFATITISVGVGAWIIAFLVFSTQMQQYFPDTEVLEGAFDWMNLGGVLAGFGVVALVGYLVAAAIGEMLATLIPAPAAGGYTGGATAVGRFLASRPVGEGVDPDPQTDDGDRD